MGTVIAGSRRKGRKALKVAVDTDAAGGFKAALEAAGDQLEALELAQARRSAKPGQGFRRKRPEGDTLGRK